MIAPNSGSLRLCYPAAMQMKPGWSAAIASLIAAAACGRTEDAPAGRNGAVEQGTPQAGNGLLDRASLLLASAKAGSAAALGQDDREEQAALDGKPFEVRIRFGCASQANSSAAGGIRAGPFNVRFNSADRTLRVRATPDLTRENAQAVVAAGADAVEGFWMRRPWLLATGCPPAQPPLSTQTASEQRVGIAQAFAVGQQDGRRNGSSYEAAKMLPSGVEPSRQGYDLVLSGQLRKLQDGRVIACRVMSADVPPECIAAAHFDRVRIETPDAKTVVAEWKS
jgi:hypothetical protein